MGQQNFILEITNGVVSILVLCLLVWLFEHLRTEFRQRGLTWKMALFGMPSVAIVAALMLEKSGTAISRIVIFFWRFGGGSFQFTRTQNSLLIVGSLITASGLLWIIAILSRPRYGEWPWRASAVLAASYALLAVAFRFYA